MDVLVFNQSVIYKFIDVGFFYNIMQKTLFNNQTFNCNKIFAKSKTRHLFQLECPYTKIFWSF